MWNASRIILSSTLASAFVVSLAAQSPPLKPGLWEARSSALDANGKETAPPEQAALANMPPEMRARMAEAMKARGLSLPDASGSTKVCLTNETIASGRWQEMAADNGCTTTFSTRTATSWKWHTTCQARSTEADGEAVFRGPDSYRTTMKMTSTVNGRTIVTTRVVDSKWLGPNCGDVKPFDPASIPTGRGARTTPR